MQQGTFDLILKDQFSYPANGLLNVYNCIVLNAMKISAH